MPHLPWVLGGMLLFGTAMRLREYLGNRALWHDEAQLANNFDAMSLGQLLGGLDGVQMAPAGFIILSRCAQLIFGTHEMTFRLLPLLAGLASMPLIYLLARRLTNAWGALFALGLWVVSKETIHYSSEFKPYGLDACLTMILLLLALRVLDRRGTGGLVALAIVGLIALFVSFPALFVLGGIALVLLVEFWRRDGWRRAAAVLIVALIWGGVFTTLYVMFVANNPTRPDMQAYWERKTVFMPFLPTSAGDVEMLIGAWYEPQRMLVEGAPRLLRDRMTGLTTPLLIFAMVVMAVRQRGPLWLLILPAAALFLASCLHMYPLYDRLVLFLVPVVAALVGVAMGLVLAALAGRSTWLAYALLGSVLLVPTVETLARAIRGPQFEEMRGVLVELADQIQPGDLIYVGAHTSPVWTYYDSRTGLGDHEPVIVARYKRLAEDEVQAELERLTPYPRVWLLSKDSYIRNPGRLGSIDKLYHAALERGRFVTMISRLRSSAHLFEFDTLPASDDAPPADTQPADVIPDDTSSPPDTNP